MTHYLVVEGESELNLVMQLLGAIGAGDVRVIQAGGKNHVVALAKSISLSKRLPVAVILDADTSDSELVRDQESAFDDLVSSLPVEVPPALFLGVPTIREAMGNEYWPDQIRDFVVSNDYTQRPGFSLRR